MFKTPPLYKLNPAQINYIFKNNNKFIVFKEYQINSDTFN